jgi:hypothetical protein
MNGNLGCISAGSYAANAIVQPASCAMPPSSTGFNAVMVVTGGHGSRPTYLPEAGMVDGSPYFSCAMSDLGSVYCVGQGMSGSAVNSYNVTDWSAADAQVQVETVTTQAAWVAAGGEHVCTVSIDGKLNCFGSNARRQLVSNSASDVAPALAMATQVLPSVSVVYGSRDAPLAALSVPLKAVTLVAAGLDFTCAVLAKGWAVCFGANDGCQTGGGPLLSWVSTMTSDIEVVLATRVTLPASVRVAAIAAGARHACAISHTGELYCWGDCGPECGHALVNPGIVCDPGAPGPVVLPPSAAAVIAVAAGNMLTCIVTLDKGPPATTGGLPPRSVYCFGRPGNGAALGQGAGTVTADIRAATSPRVVLPCEPQGCVPVALSGSATEHKVMATAVWPNGTTGVFAWGVHTYLRAETYATPVGPLSLAPAGAAAVGIGTANVTAWPLVQAITSVSAAVNASDAPFGSSTGNITVNFTAFVPQAHATPAELLAARLEGQLCAPLGDAVQAAATGQYACSLPEASLAAAVATFMPPLLTFGRTSTGVAYGMFACLLPVVLSVAQAGAWDAANNRTSLRIGVACHNFGSGVVPLNATAVTAAPAAGTIVAASVNGGACEVTAVTGTTITCTTAPNALDGTRASAGVRVVVSSTASLSLRSYAFTTTLALKGTPATPLLAAPTVAMATINADPTTCTPLGASTKFQVSVWGTGFHAGPVTLFLPAGALSTLYPCNGTVAADGDAAFSCCCSWDGSGSTVTVATPGATNTTVLARILPPLPLPPQLLGAAAQLSAASGVHGVAALSDGSIAGWGWAAAGTSGCPGRSTVTDPASCVSRLPGGQRAAAVYTGYSPTTGSPTAYTAAVSERGKLFMLGSAHVTGATGVGSAWGSAAAWTDVSAQVSAPAGGVAALAAGPEHVCAVVQADGGLSCWGSGADGRLMRSNVYSSYGGTSDSTPNLLNENTLPTVLPPSAAAVAQASAGSDFTCMVMVNGAGGVWRALHGLPDVRGSRARVRRHGQRGHAAGPGCGAAAAGRGSDVRSGG